MPHYVSFFERVLLMHRVITTQLKYLSNRNEEKIAPLFLRGSCKIFYDVDNDVESGYINLNCVLS